MNFHLEQRGIACTAYPGTGLTPLPHLHKHLEIVMLTQGETLAVADSREVLMETGDLYIAFPNQIHYYLDRLTPSRHNILIVSPDILPEFRREFTNFIPVSPVLKGAAQNPRVVSAVENMVDSFAASGKYLNEQMKGNMLVLLSELFASMPLEKKPAADTNLLSDIIKYCYENYTEDITLDSMARALHVSRFYISHLFGSQFHTSFRDYINSLRIGQAKELMRQKELSVTEIAFAVGYNSARTFGRCFRQLEGESPTEYRRRLVL